MATGYPLKGAPVFVTPSRLSPIPRVAILAISSPLSSLHLSTAVRMCHLPKCLQKVSPALPPTIARRSQRTITSVPVMVSCHALQLRSCPILRLRTSTPTVTRSQKQLLARNFRSLLRHVENISITSLELSGLNSRQPVTIL